MKSYLEKSRETDGCPKKTPRAYGDTTPKGILLPPPIPKLLALMYQGSPENKPFKGPWFKSCQKYCSLWDDLIFNVSWNASHEAAKY